MINTLTRRPFISGLALGTAHALLLALAFPPIGIGVLGVLAPLPLLLLAMFTDRPWRSGPGAAIGSLPFWAYHHWWVFAVSAAGAPPLVVIQSLWPGMFVALGALLVQREPTLLKTLGLALLWSGVEFFRARVFFDGYPWFLTAHPTADLPLAKWASVIGVYGLGLLIALLGSLFLFALVRREGGIKRWLAPGVCLGVLAAGGLLPGPGTRGSLTVGVVQTNLPQSNKMSGSLEERMEDFKRWGILTLQAADAEPRPDLLIWPETMFPGATLSPQAIDEFRSYERRAGFPEGRRSFGTLFIEPLLIAQEQIAIPWLIGAIGYDALSITVPDQGDLVLDFEDKYNSAFLIENGEIRQERYDKIFLTPFGETMPYISRFPRLEETLLNFAARGMNFDLTAGTLPIRFEIERPGQDTIRVATPICFEATISPVCRSLAFEEGQRKADVLINITNDGWFGSFDTGRANHLLIARWRAIELGTPVVRAANTGISCVVDASGRVRSSLGARQPAEVLLAEVPLPERERTIYALIGDTVGWLAFTGSLGLSLVGAIHRRSQRKNEDSQDPETSDTE